MSKAPWKKGDYIYVVDEPPGTDLVFGSKVLVTAIASGHTKVDRSNFFWKNFRFSLTPPDEPVPTAPWWEKKESI